MWCSFLSIECQTTLKWHLGFCMGPNCHQGFCKVLGQRPNLQTTRNKKHHDPSIHGTHAIPSDKKPLSVLLLTSANAPLAGCLPTNTAQLASDFGTNAGHDRALRPCFKLNLPTRLNDQPKKSNKDTPRLPFHTVSCRKH